METKSECVELVCKKIEEQTKMADMEPFRRFTSELATLVDHKPPISRSKMMAITKAALKAHRFYKNVVELVEQFIQKCDPEFRIYGLYVMDSIIRHAKHRFKPENQDIFANEFARNLTYTFVHVYRCPENAKEKVGRVLSIWQKQNVYDPVQVVATLVDMADPNHPNHQMSPPKPPNPDDEEYFPDFDEDSGDENVSKNDKVKNTTTTTLEESISNSKTVVEDSLQKSQQEQKVENILSNFDALGSILTNPTVLQQLQRLQEQMSLSTTTSTTLNTAPPSQTPADSTVEDHETEKKREPKSWAEYNKLKEAQGGGDQRLATTSATLQPVPKKKLESSLAKPFHTIQPEVTYQQQQQQARELMLSMTTFFQPNDNNQNVPKTPPPPAFDPDDLLQEIELPPSVSSSECRSSQDEDEGEDTIRRREEEEKAAKEAKRRASYPPIKPNHLSVCSTTIWVGHLSKQVVKKDLTSMFAGGGGGGGVASVDMIASRGCAYVVMTTREDSFNALETLQNCKLQGKPIILAWAPPKNMSKKWKDYWKVEPGAAYIPWTKLSRATNVDEFGDGGCLDELTLPPFLQESAQPNQNQQPHHQQQQQHPGPMGFVDGQILTTPAAAAMFTSATTLSAPFVPNPTIMDGGLNAAATFGNQQQPQSAMPYMFQGGQVFAQVAGPQQQQTQMLNYPYYMMMLSTLPTAQVEIPPVANYFQTAAGQVQQINPQIQQQIQQQQTNQQMQMTHLQHPQTSQPVLQTCVPNQVQQIQQNSMHQLQQISQPQIQLQQTHQIQQISPQIQPQQGKPSIQQIQLQQTQQQPQPQFQPQQIQQTTAQIQIHQIQKTIQQMKQTSQQIPMQQLKQNSPQIHQQMDPQNQTSQQSKQANSSFFMVPSTIQPALNLHQHPTTKTTTTSSLFQNESISFDRMRNKQIYSDASQKFEDTRRRTPPQQFQSTAQIEAPNSIQFDTTPGSRKSHFDRRDSNDDENYTVESNSYVRPTYGRPSKNQSDWRTSRDNEDRWHGNNEDRWHGNNEDRWHGNNEDRWHNNNEEQWRGDDEDQWHGNKAQRWHGDKEEHGHGNSDKIWRGDTEQRWQQNDNEKRRHGDNEKRRRSDKEKRWNDDTEERRIGNTEKRRHDDTEERPHSEPRTEESRHDTENRRENNRDNKEILYERRGQKRPLSPTPSSNDDEESWIRREEQKANEQKCKGKQVSRQRRQESELPRRPSRWDDPNVKRIKETKTENKEPDELTSNNRSSAAEHSEPSNNDGGSLAEPSEPTSSDQHSLAEPNQNEPSSSDRSSLTEPSELISYDRPSKLNELIHYDKLSLAEPSESISYDRPSLAGPSESLSYDRPSSPLAEPSEPINDDRLSCVEPDEPSSSDQHTLAEPNEATIDDRHSLTESDEYTNYDPPSLAEFREPITNYDRPKFTEPNEPAINDPHSLAQPDEPTTSYDGPTLAEPHVPAISDRPSETEFSEHTSTNRSSLTEPSKRPSNGRPSLAERLQNIADLKVKDLKTKPAGLSAGRGRVSKPLPTQDEEFLKISERSQPDERRSQGHMWNQGNQNFGDYNQSSEWSESWQEGVWEEGNPDWSNGQDGWNNGNPAWTDGQQEGWDHENPDWSQGNEGWNDGGRGRRNRDRDRNRDRRRGRGREEKNFNENFPNRGGRNNQFDNHLQNGPFNGPPPFQHQPFEEGPFPFDDSSSGHHEHRCRGRFRDGQFSDRGFGHGHDHGFYDNDPQPLMEFDESTYYEQQYQDWSERSTGGRGQRPRRRGDSWGSHNDHRRNQNNNNGVWCNEEGQWGNEEDHFESCDNNNRGGRHGDNHFGQGEGHGRGGGRGGRGSGDNVYGGGDQRPPAPPEAEEGRYILRDRRDPSVLMSKNFQIKKPSFISFDSEDFESTQIEQNDDRNKRRNKVVCFDDRVYEHQMGQEDEQDEEQMREEVHSKDDLGVDENEHRDENDLNEDDENLFIDENYDNPQSEESGPVSTENENNFDHIDRQMESEQNVEPSEEMPVAMETHRESTPAPAPEPALAPQWIDQPPEPIAEIVTIQSQNEDEFVTSHDKPDFTQKNIEFSAGTVAAEMMPDGGGCREKEEEEAVNHGFSFEPFEEMVEELIDGGSEWIDNRTEEFAEALAEGDEDEVDDDRWNGDDPEIQNFEEVVVRTSRGSSRWEPPQPPERIFRSQSERDRQGSNFHVNDYVSGVGNFKQF